MNNLFLKNTIQSSYIKALLADTPLPVYKTVSDGDYIVCNDTDNTYGIRYVYNGYIIQCTKSGYINNGAVYKKISKFLFTTKYTRYTYNYFSSSSVYDSATHEQLGKLLRCYRDIYNVNLMPFYNCFSNRLTDSFFIKPASNATNTASEVRQTRNKKYTIYKIPIRLNTDYTIALDCATTVLAAPAFILNNLLLEVTTVNSDASIDLTALVSNNIYYKTNTSFSSPWLINIDTTNNTNKYLLEKYEKYLYLLLLIPKDISTSVVILEGDYRQPTHEIDLSASENPSYNINYDPDSYFEKYDSITFSVNDIVKYLNKLYKCITAHTVYRIDPSGTLNHWFSEYFYKISQPKTLLSKVVDGESFGTMARSLQDDYCYSHLSLLLLNDSISYPFSDRLMEYLLGNVICDLDTNSTNIEKVQKSIRFFNYSDCQGLWTEELRQHVFNTILDTSKVSNLDLIGYVDKTVERCLQKSNPNIIW